MQHPYWKTHWKLGVHLILKTKRFGVNNLWWSSFPSTWGLPFAVIIIRVLAIVPLWKSYTAMKIRMGKSFGFVPLDN